MSVIDLLLRPLRTPTVTRSYPPHADVPDRGTRGTPALRPERCTGNGTCAEVCPTAAIRVTATRDGGRLWELDYGACVFCGRCIESCPDGAIEATSEFELSARRRDDVVARHRIPEDARG